MAYSAPNRDRVRIVAGAIAGGVRMERARKIDDKWTKIGVEIEARTLRNPQWTPLSVLRWYREILSSALTFGVGGNNMEMAQPTSVTPLGVPTAVLTAINIKKGKSK